MHPILLKVGPVTLYSYGVMLVVAFVAAAWLAVRRARRMPAGSRAVSPEQILDLFSLTLLGGILGARMFYVMLHWDLFMRAPLEIVAIWHGGLVWYGGLAGGVLAVALYARAHRLGFLRVVDQCIPFLALGHAIGRVGCLLNGCCYGKPTDAWCGLVFPGATMAVVPTQLLEAAGLLLLYVILRLLQRPVLLQYPGRLFGGYLAGYAALRFGLEFARGDQAPWWMGLTLQQGLSIGMALAGVVLLCRRVLARRG